MEERKGLRITTWNVNGIRNPFGYQPWRQDRTFAAMFEILEADIVIMQETKIQRKDLKDDMVLVPGWDVFFSLPKHKKGYSGVVIYTRNSMCAPIRAEEGITGILTPPNSSTSFHDLPEDQQIGGYPTLSQLADCPLDAATLDSEGRCVILEFPAFILIGTYCPAHRDETRDEFRVGYLTALDARVRNLVAAGKRVFLAGDLNIIRDELDTANAEERCRKEGVTIEEYLSMPARRMLNQLLVGGKVIGDRDEGREKPVMWDICRSFHPTRKGMFTCWEQKINARPGNFGSRIDYVLCSENWKDWFCESNIQEGLMGSDHCPVYAILKQKVEIDGREVDIRDLMSSGMFKDGIRKREWSVKDLLPTSAKLIPEFNRRRNIRDMFSKKPSLPIGDSLIRNSTNEENVTTNDEPESEKLEGKATLAQTATNPKQPSITPTAESQETIVINSSTPATKRSNPPSSIPTRPQKRGKTNSSSRTSAVKKGQPEKGQSSLMGFFKSRASQSDSQTSSTIDPESETTSSVALSDPPTPIPSNHDSHSVGNAPSQPIKFNPDDQESVIDPIVAKESWSKLLGKRVVPRCEHDEPCVPYVTKKPGVNCGRSFYLCPRPVGPSGQKERNSQWRCGTFIWSSDWSGNET